MPGDNRWPRWSPDGTQLAFVGNGSIYIVPALGGAPRKFVDEGAFPTWSPDGRDIAYVSSPAAGLAPTSQALAPAAIWIGGVAGGEPRKLTEEAAPSALSWSPNGQLLAFVIWNSAFLTGRNFNFAPCVVMVIPVAGGEAKVVSDSISMNTSPDWTSDSRTILYVSNQSGPRDVFQQRIRGDGSRIGAPVRLTTGLNAQSITLSRVGTQLAYATLELRSGVWSAPISAGGVTPFAAARAETNENESVEGMFVSRDGKWLLYDSNRSGNSDIYKIRLDVPVNEREPVQLTTDDANDFAPRLSSDGSAVAFYSMRFGTRDVFVMRADGTNQERVTSLPGNEYQPDWSPDGRSLVFVYADTDALYTVMLVSRGGDGRWSAPRPLSTALVRLPRLDILPARWSPDGSTFAVASNDSIHFVSPNGVIERSIGRPWADPTDLEGSMLWNPVDNSLIVHQLPANGLNTFWSVPRAGKGESARMLLRLDDPTRRPRGRNEFATDGRRIYFAIANDEADVRVMTLTRR
jgi:Tol biopolymer transport system component